MLLTIYNLPSDANYDDVKNLLEAKCGLRDLILDKLVPDGPSMKLTVGLADEEDAAIMTRKINGIYYKGQQLYVQDARQKRKLSEQPYKPTTKFLAQLNQFGEMTHQSAQMPQISTLPQNQAMPQSSILPGNPAGPVVAPPVNQQGQITSFNTAVNYTGVQAQALLSLLYASNTQGIPNPISFGPNQMPFLQPVYNQTQQMYQGFDQPLNQLHQQFGQQYGHPDQQYYQQNFLPNLPGTSLGQQPPARVNSSNEQRPFHNYPNYQNPEQMDSSRWEYMNQSIIDNPTPRSSDLNPKIQVWKRPQERVRNQSKPVSSYEQQCNRSQRSENNLGQKSYKVIQGGTGEKPSEVKKKYYLNLILSTKELCSEIWQRATDDYYEFYSCPVKCFFKRKVLLRVIKLLDGRLMDVDDIKRLYRSTYPLEKEILDYLKIKKHFKETRNLPTWKFYENSNLTSKERTKVDNLTKNIESLLMKYNERDWLQKYPGGDVQLYMKYRLDMERESKMIPYAMHPRQESFLNEQVKKMGDILLKIFQTTVDDSQISPEMTMVCDRLVKLGFNDLIPKFIYTHISKRVTNKGPRLVKVEGFPILPPRSELETFLKKHKCYSMETTKKNNSLMKEVVYVGFPNFELSDKLVYMGSTSMADGAHTINLHFSYLTFLKSHINIPRRKCSAEEYLEMRENYIKRQKENSDVDILDKNWKILLNKKDKFKANEKSDPDNDSQEREIFKEDDDISKSNNEECTESNNVRVEINEGNKENVKEKFEGLCDTDIASTIKDGTININDGLIVKDNAEVATDEEGIQKDGKEIESDDGETGNYEENYNDDKEIGNERKNDEFHDEITDSEQNIVNNKIEHFNEKSDNVNELCNDEDNKDGSNEIKILNEEKENIANDEEKGNDGEGFSEDGDFGGTIDGETGNYEENYNDDEEIGNERMNDEFHEEITDSEQNIVNNEIEHFNEKIDNVNELCNDEDNEDGSNEIKIVNEEKENIANDEEKGNDGEGFSEDGDFGGTIYGGDSQLVGDNDEENDEEIDEEIDEDYCGSMPSDELDEGNENIAEEFDQDEDLSEAWGFSNKNTGYNQDDSDEVPDNDIELNEEDSNEGVAVHQNIQDINLANIDEEDLEDY